MAAPPAGDWFHCNRCYRQEGARFSVTSCGHVLCEACLGAGPCPICAAACRRFPIPEQLEETLFLKSPAAIARQRLAHISQAWRFQQAQVDLLLASHRDTARRAEAALRDTRRALDSKQREAEALRRENGELRRHLREAEVSPTWRSSRSSTPRPIGITSPATTVTPQPRQQLSGQVVSRLASLEFPSASSTPTWLAPPWLSPPCHGLDQARTASLPCAAQGSALWSAGGTPALSSNVGSSLPFWSFMGYFGAARGIRCSPMVHRTPPGLASTSCLISPCRSRKHNVMPPWAAMVLCNVGQLAAHLIQQCG
ncbi:RING finger protein 212B isoform X3 [Phasianus colchicus]|uniref:RING finger protein 212B isoform X3 n=1 Tax=Phasianus colchicus TaxID=9054 RepID=UPI00129D6240|nr:RING finger protein 212B isoform X3 [Phasianus colchicus]